VTASARLKSPSWAGAKTLTNVVCAEGGASLAKMPGGMEWKKRYDAKYPNQFQVYSPYTYDATMLLDAMKRANSVDPKVYTPEIRKSNFKGVTAAIAFEENGEMKNPAITLYKYGWQEDASELIYKGFSPKVKRFPHRDASRSDGSRNAFLN
jgi:ABC-type branched-subunit amino acid transport system substrate-binding protein